MMTEKLKQYGYLMRLHKPIGIFLLLWPTLWALWLAGQGHPRVINIFVFVLGVIIMRSAGCIINDFADRHVDGHVARTSQRPLVTGKIKPKEAIILFSILLLIAFLLALSLNTYAILLAFPAALFAMIYPFLKRVTHLPQVGLGIAFSWGVPMAFAAENNALTWKTGLVFLAAFIWPIIYDTFYAMVDEQDDRKVGIKSTAILWGKNTIFITQLLQMIFLIVLALVGYAFALRPIYFLSVIVALLLCVYQQQLVRTHLPEKCFKAFLNNHWLGLAIFVGIILSYENCC